MCKCIYTECSPKPTIPVSFGLGLGVPVAALAVLHLNLDPPLLELLAVHLDGRRHYIPGLDLAHALGRSGQDQVALLEGHDARDLGQEARDAVEHQAGRVGLALLGAHAQAQEGVVRIGQTGLGDLLGNGQESVEALGDRPGESLLLSLFLDVAGGHVDAEEVA